MLKWLCIRMENNKFIVGLSEIKLTDNEIKGKKKFK